VFAALIARTNLRHGAPNSAPVFAGISIFQGIHPYQQLPRKLSRSNPYRNLHDSVRWYSQWIMRSTVQVRWILLHGRKTSGSNFGLVCFKAGGLPCGVQGESFLH
jgi:hypothetical protein